MHVNQVRVVMEHSKPIQGKNINNQQMREMKGVGSWDEQDSIWTFEEAEEDALVSFTKQIRESGRMFLPMSDEKIMLEKLYLIDHQHLKNAAAVFLCESEFCDTQMVVYQNDDIEHPSKLHRFHGRWEKVIAEAEENIQKETEGYPESAVHELLINAFVIEILIVRSAIRLSSLKIGLKYLTREFSQRAMMKKIFAAVVSVLYPQIL